MRLFDELIAVGARLTNTAPTRVVKGTDMVVVYLSRVGDLLHVARASKDLSVTTYAVPRGNDVYPTPGPIETAVYALGWSPDKPDLGAARHEAYRALARRVADKLGPTGPAAAICTFLARGDQKLVHARLPELGASGLTWIYFQVDGAPAEWWRAPAVEEIAAELVESKAVSDTYVDCPFCGEYAPAARLFGDSDKSALISFNNASSEAYGARQGLVAPTCRSCASKMTAGLDALLRDRTASEAPAGVSGVRYVWWDASTGAGLWPNFRRTMVTMSGVVPQPVRDAALPERACLLVLERNKKRWAACRFTMVRGADLSQRWERWREAVGTPWPVQVTSLVVGRDRSRSDQDTAWDRVYTEIVLHLIGGEGFSHAFERGIQRAIERAAQCGERAFHAERLREYVTGLRASTDPRVEEGKMEASAFYWLGRAYRRAAEAQRRRVNPQRGLDAAVSRMSSQCAERIEALVRRHMTYRSNGNEVSDRLTLDYLTRVRALAHEQCGTDWRAVARWYRVRPNGPDRSAFLAGYHTEGESIRERFRAAPAETSTEAPAADAPALA